MIYLIGGPPGAGKTTLGTHAAGQLGVPTLTIDDIRTALLATTSPESHPELHIVGLPDPWTYFTERTPDQLVGDAVTQHTALWPAIEKVIGKRLSNGQDIVIDGWHLMPSLVASSEFDGVTAVWVDVAHDELERRERSLWDFYAQSNDPELMFSNFLQRSIRWNDLMRSEASAHGYTLLSQDGSRSVDDLSAELLSL